jgi:hypothetical protein
MRPIIICIIVLFAAGCASDPKPAAEEIRVYDTSTLYYDIPLAVQNEITQIKRNASLIYSITSAEGRRDSARIDTIQLTALAAPFLRYNLNERIHRRFYKEDVFEDNDLGRVILTYGTNHPDLAVKSASVWLNNESHALTNINIKRLYAVQDSLYDEDLSWVAGKNFLVLQKISAGGKEHIRQTQVFWKKR